VRDRLAGQAGNRTGPLGVNRVAPMVRRTLPVYTNQQTSLNAAAMSQRCQKRNWHASFDHLVGQRQELIRNCETERLGSFEIDQSLELGVLLNGQVSRLFASPPCCYSKDYSQENRCCNESGISDEACAFWSGVNVRFHSVGSARR
jgi:hypothetical protein